MPYTADDTLSSDATFRGRVRMSMVKQAQNVASEARTVRNTVDGKRNKLAVSILNDPASFVDRFTHGAIEAGTLTAASLDPAIDAAISAIWNGVAGVAPADLA
jgi:hypothetical protein